MYKSQPLAQPPVASGRLTSDGTRLYAVLPDFDQVAVVEDGEVTRVDVCDRPVSLALDPDSGSLAVACRDGAVVLDSAGEVTPVHSGDITAVLWSDGLWALHRDGRLLSPSGELSASLPGQVLVASEGVLSTARFKSPPDHGLWWDGVEHRLERDPGPDSDTNARGVPNLLGTGAMRPDGGLLVWGGLKSNTERGLYNEGELFSNDNVVRSVLKVVDPLTAEEQIAPLFDNRDIVGAVAFTPLGCLLYTSPSARD